MDYHPVVEWLVAASLLVSALFSLVGSIGLVAAVPLTTLLAAITVRVDRVR